MICKLTLNPEVDRNFKDHFYWSIKFIFKVSSL